jgi:AcrR family transcriptional regulator
VKPEAQRRRGAVLEEAILDAAAEELGERGYGGFTMERVAKRAGTNKNALYRRWPNRAALGLDAYRRLVRTTAEVPDTGTLRGDMLELLRLANRHWSSPYGEIVRGLIADLGGAPQLLARLREGNDGGPWVAVLERAVERGQASENALHPRVAMAPIALLRGEYLTRGQAEVPDDVLVEIVDEIYLPLIRGRSGGVSR